jgi:hypothetical protein
MQAFNNKTTNTPICETAIDSDAYERLCKKLRSCYEVIPDEVPVCLYADIDCKHAYGEYEFLQIHTNMFIDYAKRAITKFCPDDVPRFAVATASSPDYMDDGIRKMCHSVHIHIPNIKMMKNEQNLFWKKMNDLMNTHIEFKDWSEYIGTKDNKFFDESVYNKNGKLRSVYCSKINQNRPLILVEGTFKETIISLGDKDAIVKNVDISEKQTKKTHNKCSSVITFSNESNNCDEKLLELGNIIEIKYLDEYYDWTRIVWSLRSESEKYETTAREISQRSEEYTDDGFDKIWNVFNKENITIGTFYNYCKMSNEKAYNEICAKYNISKYISIHDLEDVYKCSTIISLELKKTLILCKENWYVLVPETQLWKQIKEPTFYVISEIRKYIDYSNAKLGIKMIGIDGEEKDKLIGIQKEYLKYYTKINASGYITMCVKNLRAQLVNDLFEEKLDTTPGVLAFKNGVMDLKTKTFRQFLRWDDYLTDTIPYDWKPSHTDRMDYVKSILKKILNNNTEHLEYYLSVIGYSFIGMPQLEKSLYFMIDGTDNGKGDNGKTFFFDILNTLMPYYVYKSKGSMLEDGNSKVHKQLCMTKGKRLVWLDEFSTKKTNAVLIKEVADGKTIENEIMFGTSESINILYKMFILSNHIPNMDSNEEAVYNRYKQISFGSHFDRTGMRKEANSDKLLFIADCGLSDKLKNEYYNEIFNLVIEYAAKYFINKLPQIPEKFQKDAQETKMKNDEFGMWFNENCKFDDSRRLALEILRENSGFDDKAIKEGMKRIGIKYDSNLSKMGRNIFGKFYKGGFEGCYYKEFNDE